MEFYGKNWKIECVWRIFYLFVFVFYLSLIVFFEKFRPHLCWQQCMERLIVWKSCLKLGLMYVTFPSMFISILWIFLYLIILLKQIIMKNYQVLMFDVCHGRTCLHYAAYYGHSSCLKAILSAARSSPVAASWLVLFDFGINFFPNWFGSVMYFDDF